MLASLSAAEREAILAETPPEVQAALAFDWDFWARDEQKLPAGAWTFWLILAGRGFGKTRTGAETVRQWAKSYRFINLIGATADDARDIMIEGESGILAICPPDDRPVYEKGNRRLLWPSGATSLIFTADEPERLRGKQHEKLWADEMAAWRYPEAWDQAMFGLRLGDRPQAVITTTPRPTNAVKSLLHDPHTHVTRGSTYDNRANLAPEFFSKLITKYEGTRLGRQELNAEVLLDMPGALWQRTKIDEMRVPADDRLRLERIVVGVDPAISSGETSNETGIVVAARGEDGHGYTLADVSGVYTPNEWARQVAAVVRKYEADAVVAETNQGGEMVESVVRSVLPDVRYIGVRASRGKFTRAEPVAALYEQGRVHHVGRLDKLEDQMSEFTPDFDRKVQGYSPDRVDALVWAYTELFPSLVHRVEQEEEWEDSEIPAGGY